MIKKDSLFLLLIGFLFIWGACAKIVSPTGGPKDEIPPVILGSFPEQGSNKVKENEVIIEFDEFVELSDPGKVVISPYSDPPPEIKIKGKSIVIKFEEDLQKDITYHVDFKDAIQDLNERNAIENFSYVVSTGEVIDSVEIQGTVVYSLDGKAVENALVGLYPANSDSLFLKQPPLYIAKTDKEGKYSIRFIKPGTYELTVLEDKNFNDYFDLPNELIAFQDSNIVLEDKQSYLADLQLFEEASTNRVLNVDKALLGKVLVELAQSNAIVESRWLGEASLKDSFRVNKLEEKQLEILTYYENKNPQQLLLLESGLPFDTIQLELQEIEPDSFDLKTNLTVSRNSFLEFGDTLEIQGNYPIRSVNFSNSILKVKDSIDLVLSNNLIQTQITQTGVSLFYDWQEAIRYTLIVPPNSVTSMYNQQNQDSLSLSFTLRSESDYGILTMKIDNYEEIITAEESMSYFYQLKTPKGKELERGLVQDSIVRFEQLLAGKYEFFVTEDLNKNGKWDSGDYLSRKQPERIYNPDGEIDVKSNWETEILMNIE